MPRYRVQLLDAFAAPAAMREWSALAELPQDSLRWFRSPGWAAAWWRTVGRRAQPLPLAVSAGDELVAVAPWCLSDGAVRSLGDPLNDVNGLTVRAGHDETAVLRALIAALAGPRRELLQGARELLLEAWPRPFPADLRSAAGFTERPPTCAPILDLPPRFDDCLAALPPPSRRRLLQAERRLARALPRLRFEVAGTPRRKLDLARAMLRLREASLGPRGLLADCEPNSREEPFGRLLTALLDDSAASRGVVLGALVDAGEPVAAGLYFHSAPVLMKYMQGWSADARRWSPGTVLDLRMIEHAVGLGARLLDFGRGDEPYKTRLGARPRWLSNATVSLVQPLSPQRAGLPTGARLGGPA